MPRVLFVTPHAFNKTTGTGITFTNLFAGWPKDRIATVHDDTFPVTTDVCERYFRLTAAEIRRLDFGLSAFFPRPEHQSGGGAPATPAPPRDSVKIRARQWIFGDGLPQTGVLTPALESWIADFKPDLIFTILGSIGLMELVGRIGDRFRLPLVVHVMDDWMSAQFRSGLLAPFQRRRMERLVGQLIARAGARLGICEAMCQAFEQRYGRTFTPIQNTVDVERWSNPAFDPGHVNDPVRVVYAGSVLANAQLDSLADCCEAVARLAAGGRRIALDIYSPESLVAPHRPRLETHPAIRIHPPLTDDDAFFRTLAAADILLMPSNFDAGSVRFIRYSMPTRVPAYLASGTPILVYGSPDVAQVRYARKDEWGLVVDQRDISGLAAALENLIDRPEIRQRIHDNAAAAAKSHDVRFVRAAFRSALRATAANS